MQISDEGLRLIRSFEGYHTRLKDGSCAAYLCPAHVPTIGFGCTEGVKLGMVWTAEEAEAALRREIAKFEAVVNRLVTASINQNEFDAMVSLAYNIGAAAFERSSVLKRLNKGNRAGAAQAFEMWNKGGGRVLPGLVSRRKREAALFLKPVEAPQEPAMPQAVTEAKPVTPTQVAIGTAVAAPVAVEAVTTVLPSLPVPDVPVAVTQSVTNIEAWKSTGGQLWTFAAWLTAHPMQGAALVLCVAAIWLGPSFLRRKA
jgi:lysozyme